VKVLYGWKGSVLVFCVLCVERECAVFCLWCVCELQLATGVSIAIYKYKGNVLIHVRPVLHALPLPPGARSSPGPQR
jgi:hypothetical protein